ncbi:MAG: PASTA domain-containing protein [Phycisphaerae bacterium]|nr:PASTA domain-containing protein [Phycisphaerae bacterium]NIP54786.1 PASTA domain-containing protein [Phycisphaerae bacterium]NIS50498.1 PASTA domain-containing protein [Phycisphaerae bacterium]NIU11103.1 PASTA domain-containing protein [Phycisphaerae bacterium]NIU58989.1 PASTA domain-containing protein [Phycisphaerae bacterium]
MNKELLLAFFVVTVVTGPAFAGIYGGGSGTAQDPYLIYDASHLNTIGTEPNDMDKHFMLMADVDLSAYAGTSFNIIGSSSGMEFTGIFDGNGHLISNFTYADPERPRVGLFGYTGGEANIRNVTLVNVNVVGYYYVGGLVGYNEGDITNCHVSGHVNGHQEVGGLIGFSDDGAVVSDCSSAVMIDEGSSNVGCLIGYNYYTLLLNCCATGDVITTGYAVGGLSGYSRGPIVNCSASGNVSGDGSVGGLVGECDNGPGTFNCFATGNVSATYKAGGLIGRNYMPVGNCYATGAVDAYNMAGGLIGESIWDPVTENCYAVGPVAGVDDLGGLVGRCNDDGLNFVSCFWDAYVNPTLTGIGNLQDPNDVIAETTENMQVESTFTSKGWDFVGEMTNGPSDDWAMPFGGGYPVFCNQLDPLPPLPAFSGGSGTEADPFILADANDLSAIGHNLRLIDKHFRVVNNIDMEDSAYFIIADGEAPFTGVFDGNGHCVSNLTYTSDQKNKIGLFAYLGNGGQIKNLGLSNVNIDAGEADYVGGLVGLSEEGTISNCYVTGSVSGFDYVSVLVGYVDSGAVSNCYATGSVGGYTPVGGLIGYSRNSNVTNCYAAVSVVGTVYIGGFIGRSSYNSYLSCFYDSDINPYLVGIGSGSDPNVVGRTREIMQIEDTFTSCGWDFVGETANGTEDIWLMPPCGYPAFSWQQLVFVPDVAGMLLDDAKSALRAAGLNFLITSRNYSDSVPGGSVIEFSPEAGSIVADNSSIIIVVSAGPCPYEGGTGAKGAPCRINNVSHLQTLANTPEDYDLHFILTNDIDLSGFTYTNAVIASDPCNYYYAFDGTPFTGSFNGNRHKITGLTIDANGIDSDHIGLFGQIGPGGSVYDLTVEDVNISCGKGSVNTGGLVGKIFLGRVENCIATGTVSGYFLVGGLAGYNYRSIILESCALGSVQGGRCVGGLVGESNKGSILRCGANENVTGGYEYTGGLVGLNVGPVDDSYATGNVVGTEYADKIGGLIGYNSGTIRNSYAACTVAGSGLVGREPSYGNCTYIGCFWDNTIGPTDGLGYKTDPGGMVGESTENLQTQSTFTDAGWDFVWETTNGTGDIWAICDNVDYPKLAWQFILGDIDGDENIDFGDFAQLAGSWQQIVDSFYCGGVDLNGDGRMDFFDIAIFASHWLAGTEL